MTMFAMYIGLRDIHFIILGDKNNNNRNRHFTEKFIFKEYSCNRLRKMISQESKHRDHMNSRISSLVFRHSCM